MKQRLFWLLVLALTFTLVVAWGARYDFALGGSLGLRQLSILFAVLGFFFFFLQFVLSTRHPLVERGFGLDKMIHQHRQVGRIALGFLLLHPAFFFLHTGAVLIRGASTAIGLIVLIGLAVTAFLASYHKKLNLPYEVWLNVHKANYVLFPLVFIHVFDRASSGTLFYYLWVAVAAVFLLLIAHKAMRELDIRRNPYEVVGVKQEGKDIWSLTFRGRPLAYRPGQFMHLRLLRRGELSSSHPFTLSSSPTRELLAVTPKEVGDFTRTVKDTQLGDRAYVDAPYGVFSFLNYDCQNIMFISGGIGITPFISMLRYMHDENIQIPVTLVWANKGEKELCFHDELARMEAEMVNLKVVHVMSRQKDWPGERGRIDGALIEKYRTREGSYDYFVCGPPKMNRAVLDALKHMGVPRERVHHELFEL